MYGYNWYHILVNESSFKELLRESEMQYAYLMSLNFWIFLKVYSLETWHSYNSALMLSSIINSKIKIHTTISIVLPSIATGHCGYVQYSSTLFTKNL